MLSKIFTANDSDSKATIVSGSRHLQSKKDPSKKDQNDRKIDNDDDLAERER